MAWTLAREAYTISSIIIETSITLDLILIILIVVICNQNTTICLQSVSSRAYITICRACTINTILRTIIAFSCSNIRIKWIRANINTNIVINKLWIFTLTILGILLRLLYTTPLIIIYITANTCIIAQSTQIY